MIDKKKHYGLEDKEDEELLKIGNELKQMRSTTNSDAYYTIEVQHIVEEWETQEQKLTQGGRWFLATIQIHILPDFQKKTAVIKPELQDAALTGTINTEHLTSMIGKGVDQAAHIANVWGLKTFRTDIDGRLSSVYLTRKYKK